MKLASCQLILQTKTSVLDVWAIVYLGAEWKESSEEPPCPSVCPPVGSGWILPCGKTPERRIRREKRGICLSKVDLWHKHTHTHNGLFDSVPSTGFLPSRCHLTKSRSLSWLDGGQHGLTRQPGKHEKGPRRRFYLRKLLPLYQFCTKMCDAVTSNYCLLKLYVKLQLVQCPSITLSVGYACKFDMYIKQRCQKVATMSLPFILLITDVFV